MGEYEGKSVAELRTIARERLGAGAWIASASKAALVSALTEGKAPSTTTEAPRAPASSAASVDLAAAIQAAMASVAASSSPAVDAAAVEEIARRVFEEMAPHPFVVEVRRPDAEPVTIEGAHPALADVLAWMAAGVPVLMVGPAGSGKTHLAESAAAALGMSFSSLSVGPETSIIELTGYMDAGGRYVGTAFRRAFEGGGVFLFDEIDAGSAAVLTGMNAGLSNGSMAFPDGMVRKSASFLCMAAANTYLRGGNRQYCGRNPIDAATVDRFAVVDVGYDLALERALSLSIAASSGSWVDRVDALRASAVAAGVEMVVSPRAALYGARRIADGSVPSFAALEAALIFRGMDPATVAKVRGGAR